MAVWLHSNLLPAPGEICSLFGFWVLWESERVGECMLVMHLSVGNWKPHLECLKRKNSLSSHSKVCGGCLLIYGFGGLTVSELASQFLYNFLNFSSLLQDGCYSTNNHIHVHFQGRRRNGRRVALCKYPLLFFLIKEIKTFPESPSRFPFMFISQNCITWPYLL